MSAHFDQFSLFCSKFTIFLVNFVHAEGKGGGWILGRVPKGGAIIPPRIYETISILKNVQHNFQKMRGGGQRLFGIFPKIHLLWYRHPSLSSVCLFDPWPLFLLYVSVRHYSWLCVHVCYCVCEHLVLLSSVCLVDPRPHPLSHRAPPSGEFIRRSVRWTRDWKQFAFSTKRFRWETIYFWATS